MTNRKSPTGTVTINPETGEVVTDPGAAGAVPDVAAQLAPVPHLDWPPEPTYPFLLSVLRREVTVRQVDTEAMSRAIAERALGAETAEEVTRNTAPIAWEALLDLPVRLVGVTFGPSAFDGGCPVYVTADTVRVADGEPMVLTVGAWSPVYQCLAFWHRGWLPRTVALTASRTKGGFDTYSLIDADV